MAGGYFIEGIDQSMTTMVWRKKKQTSIKEIDFAGLLVRCRAGFLETCITFPKLVTSSLLRLDALLANGFTAPKYRLLRDGLTGKRNFLRISGNRVTTSTSRWSRVKFLIIIV